MFTVESCVRIGQAVILGYLLDFFQSKSHDKKEGYLYAMGLSLCVLTTAMLHHVDFFFVLYFNLFVEYPNRYANENWFHCTHIQKTVVAINGTYRVRRNNCQYGIQRCSKIRRCLSILDIFDPWPTRTLYRNVFHLEANILGCICFRWCTVATHSYSSPHCKKISRSSKRKRIYNPYCTKS